MRVDTPVPVVEPPTLETDAIREPPTVAMSASPPVWTPEVPLTVHDAPTQVAAWPTLERPDASGSPGGLAPAPRRRSATAALAIVGALLVVAGLGAAGVVAWQQGWLPGGGDAIAASTSTVTATATPSQQPAEESPFGEPTPTPTELTAEELRAEALGTLEQIVADDRDLSPVRGQWVAQLASKSEGIIDRTQQPDPFTLPDILAEVRSHQANAEYGSVVRVVHQGDWGQSETGPDPMWVTFADIDMSSREDVVAWCEEHFSQRGQALLNVCYPRQMKLK